ncbi:MAG TPA: hypothetical protein PK990_00940 [Salinivirgaceae bacterium]|nr:hypothetical protein [Salinivirgaceae bacterium]
MKIGIHHNKGSYSEGWVDYCEKQKIPYKIVNAYSNDIIKQLEDCDAFMWHFHHFNPKDVLFAKQLLFSLEQSGKKVYPNWMSNWCFDDKLGQKYLLEALKLPLVPTYAFFTRQEALNWANSYHFPAVFKLRVGAGGSNVRLVRTKKDAVRLINKAFGRGFRQLDPIRSFKEQLRKYSQKKNSLLEVLKPLTHIIIPYKIERAKGREKGYVYFQDFIPNCEYDLRLQFIGDRCYAMKRFVRKNDFRASGAGNIDYDGSKIPIKAIEIGFKIANSLKMQTLAIDLIPFNETYLIAEIGYAFRVDEGECDYGYYDKNLVWHPGSINPYAWMVEDLLNL